MYLLKNRISLHTNVEFYKTKSFHSQEKYIYKFLCFMKKSWIVGSKLYKVFRRQLRSRS